MHGLAVDSEPLEWQLGQCPIGIDVQRTGFEGKQADNPARPAIERMRHAVARLGGSLEEIPLQTAREAQQDDCANWRLR